MLKVSWLQIFHDSLAFLRHSRNFWISGVAFKTAPYLRNRGAVEGLFIWIPGSFWAIGPGHLNQAPSMEVEMVGKTSSS